MNARLRGRHILSSVVALVVTLNGVAVTQAAVQCFSLELFYDSKEDSHNNIKAALEDYSAKRTGLKLYFLDVSQDENESVKKRIGTITKYFSLQELKLPAIYGLKNILFDLKTKEILHSKLNKALTMTAFVRNGCPHCRDAKAFLAKYGSRYPAIKLVYREVTTDPNATTDMYALTSRYRQSAASLPVIHFCNGLSIGFDREATTGRRILQKLDYWSKACPDEKKN